MPVIRWLLARFQAWRAGEGFEAAAALVVLAAGGGLYHLAGTTSVWHAATVGALGLALACEIWGAYCAQRGNIEKYLVEQPGEPLFEGENRLATALAVQVPWMLFWGRAVRDSNGRLQFAFWMPEGSRPHIAPMVRGVGRLVVAATFLARFTADESFTWLKLFG